MFPQIIQELQDFFEYSVFYSVSTCNPATPSNSACRINSSTRNTTTTRLISCRLLPATVSRASKHSTRQNPAIRPLQHKQASSNSKWQKQHPKRQPASHPRNSYKSSQDSPKTTCARTIQGYNSSPGHFPKTTRSRNTGQDSLLRQFVPGQHWAGLSKIICSKTYQQDIWCFRTIGPRTGIVTQLVPRHINKIYGVPRQDNRSQDRNHYIRKGLSIVYQCNTKVSVFQFTY